VAVWDPEWIHAITLISRTQPFLSTANETDEMGPFRPREDLARLRQTG
jgi:hypothetical protein